jgi:hypothetical protein
MNTRIIAILALLFPAAVIAQAHFRNLTVSKK